MRILIVEDDEDLREILAGLLARDGQDVIGVADGRAALACASHTPFDVVLLDVALGEGPDGYEVCRILRDRRNIVPIIMISALGSEADVVMGLESGADDYLIKPFGLNELRSRIVAVLRRGGGWEAGDDVLSAGRFRLDRRSHVLTVDGLSTPLTFSEYELLARLMSEPGRVISRLELREAIWREADHRDPRGIDVYMRRLRAKLEPDPHRPRHLVTVHGIGYRLDG